MRSKGGLRYGSILYQCSKGPDESKKQGDVQFNKKTVDLFWAGGTGWSTVILFVLNSGKSEYSGYGNDGDHDAILFPGNV